MNRFKPQSLTIRFGLRAVFQIGGGENRALASENVTVIAGFEAATQIVRRAEIDLVVAPFEKVDMPSGASRFALPGELRETPGYNAAAAEGTISAIFG
jgi:hypothetical protein